jgi:hypothetical protein
VNQPDEYELHLSASPDRPFLQRYLNFATPYLIQIIIWASMVCQYMNQLSGFTAALNCFHKKNIFNATETIV